MQIDELRNLQQNRIQPDAAATGPHINVGEQAPAQQPKADAAATFFAGDFNSRINNPNYDKNSIQDETLAEELERKTATFSDAQTTKRNLSMAVAGFSVEDLSGAKEEGYDIDDMEPDQIITVIDEIKMHLAMGGKDISAMGGLSDAEIAEMSGGNGSLAATVEHALSAADLPVDDEIVADGVQALQKAGEISEITPSAMEYLLKNDLEPTVENIYTGTFSQSNAAMPNIAVNAGDVDALMPQVEKLLDAADLPMDGQQRENVEWMLERDIPITTENLAYLNDLQTAEPDLSQEAVTEHIVDAVAEGRQPQEAYLIDGYSLADKAEAINDTIQNVTDEQAARVVERGEAFTAENLAREIRREENGLTERMGTNGAGTVGVAGGAGDGITASGTTGAVDGTAGTADGSVMDVQNADADGAVVTDTGNISAQGFSEAAIKAQRVLEETRLVMTQQANLSLMKQGISIDTTELSEVVEQLKNLEASFYQKTLTNNGEVLTQEELSVRIDLFEQTTTQVSDLAEMPAVLLGRIPDIAEAAIGDLHREGRSLAQTFAAADERYETMRTEVRRDLGDSMRKAFRNVDDILEDLDMETTETNRRAVRILAYNQQEITTESIGKMKAGDELVQRAFKSLTPGVVAKMIREGENPLDLSMEELTDKAEEIKAVSSSDSAEKKFSEFLYKAQKSGEFTKEERDAFIGVYRLIYQVEKTDGAVIGQLLAQGTDLSMRNLMMAARTRRHENREYAIDDDFGFAEFDRSTLSITEQIEMVFQTQRMKDAGEAVTPQKLAAFENEEYMEMTPDRFAEALEEMPDNPAEEEMQKAFDKQQRDNIAEAVRAESRVYEMLSQYDLPQSPANLEAFSQMLSDRNGMYRRLFRGNGRTAFGTEDTGIREGEVGLSDVIENLIRDFGEAVKTPEEMAEAQRNLEDVAENVMRTMLVEEPAGSIDVRGMQVTMKQIRSMGEVGQRSETYAVPILVADAVGNMTLKIVRGAEEQRGMVDLALDMEATGTIRASFRYDTDGVYGSVTTSLSATRNLLAGVADELTASMEEAAGTTVNLTLGEDRSAGANDIFNETQTDFAVREDGERPEVQTRVLYGIARSFIQTVGSLEF